MSRLRDTDPEIFKAIKDETIREEETIELIASENFVSEAVLEAQGSVLTNKYAEGYPARRWYNGCRYVDLVERLAAERARKLFGAEHANVQPHSGSQANMAAYFALLEPGDTVMALDLACGGHLTHGHPHNFSGMFYKVIPYGVNPKTEQLDYGEILGIAQKHKPKLLLAGASAYPRAMDFAKFKQIADEVGAYLFVDMAHIAGLVAAGLHQSPVPYSDIVTTTTHKTLRGPRGGMILCKAKYAKKIDAVMFPGIQGGPLMHIIAAKAAALLEAMRPEFKRYQKQVLKNTKALSGALSARGYRIVAGGTDTHLFLVDLSAAGITGRDAADALDEAGITVNKNLIPYDKQPPAVASGLRIGAAAVTTRGMKEQEMEILAGLIAEALININNRAKIAAVRRKALNLIARFPLYKKMIEGMNG